MSSAGDVIHGLPVLCALRRHRPDAFIAWLVEDWAAELLHTHPALSQVLAINRADRVHARPQDLAKWWRLRSRLRSFAFDTVFDLQGLSRSAVAGWLSGAPRRIGFDGIDARQRSRWFNNVRIEPVHRHVVDRNLELLRAVGLTDVPADFGIPPYPPEAARFEEWLGDQRIRLPFAVIAVGSSRSAKRWPVDRYARLARTIRDVHRMPSLVLWGTDDERRSAQAVVAGADGAATLLPPTTLRDIATICRRSDLVIGPDSVAIHIAAAVAATCVGLYGPTRAARNGPYGMGDYVAESTDGTMAGVDVATVERACATALTGSTARVRRGRAEEYR